MSEIFYFIDDYTRKVVGVHFIFRPDAQALTEKYNYETGHIINAYSENEITQKEENLRILKRRKSLGVAESKEEKAITQINFAVAPVREWKEAQKKIHPYLTDEVRDLLFIRNDGLKLWWAKTPQKPWHCSFVGCGELVDVTEGMGVDTSCPYHRLLYDHWMYNQIGDPCGKSLLFEDKTARRKKFFDWVAKTGQEECDTIVNEMSLVPINWKC